VPGLPQEPQVTISEPANLLFGPRSSAVSILSVLTGEQLTLLSRTEPADGKWLRVAVTDESAKQDYVGWIDASAGLLANEIRKVGVNLKLPPACSSAIASTYRGMENFSPIQGQLGRWTSKNNIDISIVIDIFREAVGTESEPFRLKIIRNGEPESQAQVRPQKKRFLLQNEVHLMTVSSGDVIELALEATESGTALSTTMLNDLHGHVSIYHVPTGCEFKDR